MLVLQLQKIHSSYLYLTVEVCDIQLTILVLE